MYPTSEHGEIFVLENASGRTVDERASLGLWTVGQNHGLLRRRSGREKGQSSREGRGLDTGGLQLGKERGSFDLGLQVVLILDMGWHRGLGIVIVYPPFLSGFQQCPGPHLGLGVLEQQ